MYPSGPFDLTTRRAPGSFYPTSSERTKLERPPGPRSYRSLAQHRFAAARRHPTLAPGKRANPGFSHPTGTHLVT